MKNIFQSRIEELRGAKSQKDFASLLGLHINTYTNWIRGKSSPPAHTVADISTRLGVSVDWLMGITDEKKPIICESKPTYPMSAPPSPPAGLAPPSDELMRLLLSYADTINRQSITMQDNAKTIISQQETIAKLAMAKKGGARIPTPENHPAHSGSGSAKG